MLTAPELRCKIYLISGWIVTLYVYEEINYLLHEIQEKINSTRDIPGFENS